MNIAVVNYDQGNMFSITNALDYFGFEYTVTNDSSVIKKCSQLLIPGVGAFDKTMQSLQKYNLIETIKNESKLGKKILGICVGMQIMSEQGYEGELTDGLGLIPGSVERLPITQGEKIPNINWHDLIYSSNEYKKKEIVYFLHSYYMKTDEKNIIAYILFGDLKIPAIINFKNIWGIQFHPEKSGKKGLNILKEILEK